MTPRHHLTALVAAATVLASASSRRVAYGADGDPCLVAPVDGQKLQRAGKLLEARERFEVCAVKSCPSEIVDSCVRWMKQVDDALPSVVVAARDEKGRDLTDVRVSIDDGAPADLGARATRLDPGAHRFVFRRDGSADVEMQVVLREGEKNREVLATFRAPADLAGATPTESAAQSERPVPALVWVVGGLGVAAVASFATFGALGVAERNADHCDTGCTQDQKNGVDSKYLVANISLGVGVVALAVATWLYLSRPAVVAPSQASVLASSPGFVGLHF